MNEQTRPADMPEIIGGRYRVLSEIGRGAMGLVLKVEHLHTGELLAMKVLLTPRPGAAHALDRFRREARSLARVRGDHVVRVIDADIATELGNTPYIVMELLDGEDLGSYLRRRGKLPAAEVSRLVHELTLGLSRVHRAGLIHRDLKPSNIYLARQEDRITVKLLDFGLVKPASGASETDLELTTEGQVVGTPLFMSPEQVHGMLDVVGPATDIWAVGIIAFYLLTGRSYWDVRQMPRGILDIGSAPLDPPSTRDPSLTAAFDKWFLCSCALNPSARWSDPVAQGRELAAALGYPDPESLSISPSGPAPGADPATVTLSARPAESGVASTISRQRRQVTVLFYRLAYSGSAEAEMDPEDFDAVESRLHSALDDAFGNLRDTSSHLAQGGRFVFFGYPVAYGQDACRAVEAALQLTAIVGRLKAQSAEAGANGLGVRVGVHTGMLLAGPSSVAGVPDVRGAALGVATDLEHAAASGQILVSEATWKMLGGRFRGQPDGNGNYQVLGEADESQGGFSPGAMIGREVELALLLSCLEEAAAGESQMALISGEVGIGKSRLLKALREHPAAAPAQWLECGCSPYFQRTPFRPLIELLRTLIQRTVGRPPSPAVSAGDVREMARRLDVDDESRELFEFLLAISNGETARIQTLSPSLRRERTIEALTSLLHRCAAARPQIVVVEDLHWADPSTLEFLERFSVLRGAPVLTLLTARLDFTPPWSSPAAVTPLQLRRLSQTQSIQLIAQTARGDLPPHVAEVVARTSGGIPLFLEEVTRVVTHNPAAVADAATGSGNVPATLREALNARLDRVGTARAVAERAAVIGTEFAVEDLRILSEDSSALDSRVRELVRAKIFQPRGLPPHQTYTFQHALLRDAAYDLMRRETRRELHSRLARAFAVRPGVEPEVLAHHCAEGGMPVEAAGWSLRAGQAALERSANAEARDYFQRGIDLLQRAAPGSPSQALATSCLEITLWTMKGMAWVVSRGYTVPEAEASFAGAMKRVRALGCEETPELAPALWAQWIYTLVRGQFPKAEEEGRRLLRLADHCGDPGITMLAHLALGTSLHGAGRFDEAIHHLDQGLKRYDAEAHASYRFLFGQDPWMFGAVFKAWALWCQGFPDRALALVTQAVAHAERLRHPNSLGFALALSAIIHHYRGEAEEVARASRELMKLSLEQGWIHWLGHARLWAGAVQVMEGNIEEGLAAMCEARKVAEQAGERSGATHYDTVVIDALLRAGRLDQAAEWIAKTRQAMQAGGEYAFEADLLRMEAELARVRGDIPAARRLFEQAIDSASSRGSLSYRLRAALSLARMEREQGGEEGEAKKRLAAVLAVFTEGFDTADVRAAMAQTHGSAAA